MKNQELCDAAWAEFQERINAVRKDNPSALPLGVMYLADATQEKVASEGTLWGVVLVNQSRKVLTLWKKGCELMASGKFEETKLQADEPKGE